MRRAGQAPCRRRPVSFTLGRIEGSVAATHLRLIVMSVPVSCKGNFTTLRYLSGLSASELERTVGFEPGRLTTGYRIIALADDETIGPDAFELKASSRWSKGAVGGKDGVGGEQIEPILTRRGQDPSALKQQVCQYFTRHQLNRPAKVLPNLRHTPGMLYPDAEALGPGIASGVPQFDLLVTKRFVVVHEQGAA